MGVYDGSFINNFFFLFYDNNKELRLPLADYKKSTSMGNIKKFQAEVNCYRRYEKKKLLQISLSIYC